MGHGRFQTPEEKAKFMGVTKASRAAQGKSAVKKE